MLKNRVTAISTILIAAILLGTGSAFAASVRAPHVEVELVAERTAWLPGAANEIALRVKPEDGWHTYWRNPGDSGLPTKLEWSLPPAWSAGGIQWPYPSTEALGELVNYGYGRETLHLVTLRVPEVQSGPTATVRAKAKWLVCKDICIPGEADLSLELPVGGIATVDPRWNASFLDARQRLPESRARAGGYQIADGAFRLQVEFDNELLGGATRAEFFPYANDLVNHGAAQRVALEPGRVRFTQALSAFYVAPEGPVEGLLVLHGSGARAIPVRAVEAAVAAVGGEAPPPDLKTATNERHPSTPRPATDPGLWLILGFAVLGGMILNLMPCVFPILAIKAVAVLESHRNERAHAMAYAAGVVGSSIAVAALLLGLRAGGEQLGWGFQLQSPGFVALLAYLIFALGLSMSGVLEFGTGLMGIGQSLTEKPGYTGSFFTGVLAVVVASPCTAPFMGTSLGFALTQPAPIALLIFAALGFGLAMPFLLLGLFPVVGRLLPKPGAWMETFKQLMAFPLYLTVVWLLWVLSRQTGSNGAALVMCGLVLLAFALWLIARSTGLARWIGAAVIAASLGLLLHPALKPLAQDPEARGGTESAAWSEKRVADLRAGGRSVFINFTADWCITCKANEVVLDSDAVKAAFAAKNVAWLTGDWTNADPEITRLLTAFGRPGVPLYLLYPPTGDPEILPQLLTRDTVTEAVDRLP